MVFKNPVLVSGLPLQVNSVYKFSNVIAGVNALITVTGKSWWRHTYQHPMIIHMVTVMPGSGSENATSLWVQQNHMLLSK